MKKNPNVVNLPAMKAGGKILARTLNRLMEMVVPGRTAIWLDQQAEKMILAAGCRPSFKTVKNYSWTTCINFDHGVVHGIPNDRQFISGQRISIDVGLIFRGWHLDMARSLIVPGGPEDPKLENFLDIGRQTLAEAIRVIKPGIRVSDISRIIESNLSKNNLYPVRALTGHGIGHQLHQEPMIPGFVGNNLNSPVLQSGQALAIEVIYSQGKGNIRIANDGWTIETVDGKIAGLFEDTVVVTSQGYQVLTTA